MANSLTRYVSFRRFSSGWAPRLFCECGTVVVVASADFAAGGVRPHNGSMLQHSEPANESSASL